MARPGYWPLIGQSDHVTRILTSDWSGQEWRGHDVIGGQWPRPGDKAPASTESTQEVSGEDVESFNLNNTVKC